MVRLFLIGGVLLLAGCSLFQKDDPRACPRVSILNDAARVAVYRDGPGRDLIDVMHEGQIGDIGWSCKYDKTQVNVLAKISFLAQRGPASDRPEASFKYFVAITADGQEILAKKVFTTVVAFPSGLSQAGVFEEIEQIIPLPDLESGPNYEIIVGFQLSEEQLKHIRKRRRF
tara:strand:- start:283 stop:798 length:516 start_codon:yes stop_codon:yes gene_type:complete